MAFDIPLLPRHTPNVSLITAQQHDLKGTGRYFATMVTEPRRWCLSEVLEGGVVKWKPLGEMVNRYIQQMCACHPLVIDCLAIMPDHLHLCFRVTAPLKISVLNILATMRTFSQNEACNIGGEPRLWDKRYRLFTAFNRESYDVCIAYTAANPERWWLTRHNADLFKPQIVTHPCLPTAHTWQAVGNLSLLEAPLIFPIVIHRVDTPTQVEEKTQFACDIAKAGGVIAGGFISPREKALLKTLYTTVPSLKLIHFSPHTLADYKPPARVLDDFKNGHRLLLTSEPTHPTDSPCSRAVCLRHNAIAEHLGRG